MTTTRAVCYEELPDDEVRRLALRRAEEVGERDVGLTIRLQLLGWGFGDGEPLDDTDYALLYARPDIPRWTAVDTGVAVMLAGRVARVGRAQA